MGDLRGPARPASASIDLQLNDIDIYDNTGYARRKRYATCRDRRAADAKEEIVRQSQRKGLRYTVVQLDGTSYAILREGLLRELCRQAKIVPAGSSGGRGRLSDDPAETDALDARAMAGRIIERRKGAGLSQAELARQAGVRIETLNRVERGKTTPDFSTIRKLMTAIKAAEARLGS